MKRQWTMIHGLVISGLILSLASVVQAAPEPVDFYRGKVIDYIVATTPGGGYDAYARLIGRYMQKYIPGCTIVVKNIPGAGHIVGANETFFAKPDGLTIGTFDKGLIISQLIGLKGVRFDMAKFGYVGKATAEPRVLIVGKKSPFKTIKEFMEAKQTIRMGTSGVGSSAHNETLIFIAATGAKHLKAVPGYPGNDLNMGLMRGDVDAAINSYDNMYIFINEGEGRVLLRLTKRPIKGLKGTFPTVYDIVKDETGLKLLTLVDHLGELGRLTTAPPNTKPERLAVLREAYKKALSDPGLIKEGQKAGFEFDPMYGEDVSKLVKEIVNQPAANVELLKKIVGKKQ
jgi:tripartite-type tricarboxylate transporter receptor subunit TctC